MSKTVYYLGAGASYGKRGENEKIIEGLPVVAEISEQFALFRSYIESAKKKIRGRFFDPFLIKGLKYPVRNKSH